MQKTLTKSKYLHFLSCPREFWLRHHSPELFPAPEGLEYEHRRKQGYDFENVAKQLATFAPDPEKYRVDFGREFSAGNLYAKADAIVTDLATGDIFIYEIKSSASVKDEHIYDAAFQKVVAEACGERVSTIFVITVNTAYVRNGDIDPESICTVTDVTARVLEVRVVTLGAIEDAFSFLDGNPAPAILGYCDSKLDCAFIRHHFPNLPDYTVFDLANLKKDKRDSLLESGVIDILDIPADLKLSDRQRRQVEIARSGEVSIERDEIKTRLDGLIYPLHFLDYETFNYAIPYRDGLRPYQQMAFQYSLHSFDSLGSEARHSSYLSRGDDDPPLEMARSLREAMRGRIGTVIVWSQGFEKTVNKQIGEMFPEYAEFFTELNEKTFDLRKMFSDQLYLHPAFKGRDSIKKVLPVLIPDPDLSYERLEIGDGMTASIRWFHMAKKNLDDAERDGIYKNLLDYCHLDTLAMVEIFKVLQAL